MTTPFRAVQAGGNFRHNAMLDGRESDAGLGFGFTDAGDALVQHWVEHGPNDALLVPMILNYRHGIELLLKAAIRDSARCLRRKGDTDPKLVRSEVDSWLARDAGHSLQSLANRLDEYLVRLELDKLPPDTHAILASIHNLDPRGDTFRYASGWDKEKQQYVPSNRPNEARIDVVFMGEQFRSAATLVGYGVLSVLEEFSDYLSEMESYYGP
jgi:hypothetical protein